MKTYSGSFSCSCTSCTYRSESERPSLRRLIAQGSRIDRLYYGKYIPLRERKLLDRLVRTRGVYDDIRAQLVSDSTISQDTTAILKPRKKLSARNVDDNQKNRAILELVDQVDKGEKLGSKELSDCCSCCSCSSKINEHHTSVGKQRHHRDHPRAKHGYARKNTGDVYNRKSVRFKAKHIRSDPCTCTYKFSGIIKKISPKRRSNQPLTVVDLQPTTDEEISQRPRKIKNLARLSYEKLQQSNFYAKNMMMEGLKKASESKSNIQEKLELQAKKSVEKLNKAKHVVKDKIQARKKLPGIPKNFDISSCTCPQKDLISKIKKDSISKFKDDLKRKQLIKNWECESECIKDICVPEECFYKLKHKQPQLFKRSKQEDNQNDIIMKELTITNSIKRPSIEIRTKKVAEITVPKVVKQKPLLRAEQKAVDKNMSKVKKVSKKQKNKNELCDCKSISSHRNIKSGTNLAVSAFPNNKNKNLHPNQTGKIRLSSQSGKIIINKRGKNVRPEKESSQRQVVRIGSSFSFNIEFYKNNVLAKDNLGLTLQRTRTPSFTKYSSDLSYKNDKLKKVDHRQRTSQVELKQKSKNSIKEENYLKRCFCTFKLKPKRSKSKRPKNKKKGMVSKESITMFTPQLLNVETNTYDTYINDKKTIKKRQKMLRYLLPYECEPGVCEPDNCDPFECIKLINMRNKKVKTRSVRSGHSLNDSSSIKNKSTTNFSSRSYIPMKNKFVQPKIRLKSVTNDNKEIQKRNINSAVSGNNGQVVRIGSSMSFNLEFYKNKSPYSIKPDISKTKNILKSVGDTSHVEKSIHKKAGINTFKRCFCILKSQDRKYIKRKKNKKVITDIEMMDSVIIMTSDKGTNIKKDRRLKPYECEPFVCIPGVCDPYTCLERINQRYNNLKEIGSMTNRTGTKNVSSITHSKKSLKNIKIQSQSKPVDRKPLAATKTNRFNEYISSALTKQSVKIGSTFSFNIEFFKTHDKSKEPSNLMKPTSLLGNKIKKHERKINKLNIGHVYTQKKEAKKLHKSSTASHVVKRCFCTLNLQKYRKKRPEKQNLLDKEISIPRVYTINRALIGTSPVLFHKEYYDESKLTHGSNYCYQNKLSQRLLLPFQEISSSSYSASVQKRVLNSSYSEQKHTSTSYLQQTEVSNLSRYVKNCFCTMNLQLANKKMAYRKPRSASIKLGSNFSCNIDFFKKSPRPRSERDNLFGSNLTRNHIKTKGIEGKVAHSNQKSQSGLPTRRCFCTFKLQKKGRWHNMKKHHLHQSSSPIAQSKTTVKSVDKAQNTTFRPMNIAHSLRPYECEQNICSSDFCDPYQCLEKVKRKNYKKRSSFPMLDIKSSLKLYECEPNICVPGECDPYKCLEIIKRRNFNVSTKESGVDTILAKRSTASLTQKNHVIKGTQRGFREKEKNNNTSGSKQSNVLKPSRQIVRVGSNMSFSVDFFKEQKPPLSYHSTYKDVKTKERDNDWSLRKQKHETSFQSSKATRHKQTEIRKFPKVASTMTTSFLKRCFCTAQLHKEDQRNKTINSTRDISSPSFLKKCFCVLKSMKISKTPKEGIYIKKIPHSNKKTNTHNIARTEENKHHPYECELGICVPGECDPYECEKKLKGNRMRNSAALATSKTRSVFTYSPSIMKKNAQMQSRTKAKHITKKTRLPHPARSVKACDRQTVKIGSNFSFNIEFYKDTNPNSSKSLKSTHFKSLSSYKDRKPRLKNERLKNNIIPTRSILTQSATSRKFNRATQGQYFLKRCFCTLRLHSQHAHEPGVKIKDKIKYEEVQLNTKSIMTDEENGLERFACEPNICVPYQCNPYECEKIMKLKRKEQHRETGVLARSIKSYSVRSMTEEFKKKKRKSQTASRENYYRKVNFYEDDKKSPPTQRVKIGSSFDFNIEFFKGKNDSKLTVNEKSVPTYKTIKNHSEQKLNNIEKDIRKHKQAQRPKIKIQSTSSQTKAINMPTLKRCFCTLFHKKSKKKLMPLKSLTSSVGTETRKLPDKELSLLPYECEPQICIPGQCDPYECLERIKERNLKSFRANTIDSEMKNTTSVTENQVKLKNKKNQYATKYRLDAKKPRPKTKIFENSKKQAVRIGSNFNFNIEFYKDKNGSVNKSAINTIQNSHDGKKSTKVKIRKLQNKKCNASNCPELKKLHKFTKPNKEENLHIEKADNNKNKQTFLKKCFCVLRLRKMRNKKLNFNNHYTISRDQNKKNISQQKLLSYECEPNICVPGECDPYKCEKRIRSRFLKEKREMNMSKAAITDKFKSKSIRLQAPKIKLKERRQNTKSYLTKNRSEKAPRNISAKVTDKQVVRVGSTFSFDIEFFKDSRNCKENLKKMKTKSKNKLRNNKTITQHKTMVSRGSKAYECLPECDIYKEKKRKSYNVSTQVLKHCADECVGILANDIYKTKNRSSHTDTATTLLTLREQKRGLVEVPRFGNNLNKQAVRIGSNFSCNIEFYKRTPSRMRKQTLENLEHKIPIKNKRQYPENTITHTNDKNFITKSPLTHNHRSQAGVETGDKSLNVQNALNRCFCTLKLQKNIHSNKHRKNIPAHVKIPPFPQTFEVRRVNVSQKGKPSLRKGTSFKTVATKINKNYIIEESALNQRCNCFFRKKTLPSNFTEMETILPYKPTKFKKTSSKTLLEMKNIHTSKKKIKGTKTMKNGKHLNKKNSQRNIYSEKQPFNFKTFLCRCVAVFTPKHRNNNLMHVRNDKELYDMKTSTRKIKQSQNADDDRLKVSKSDGRPLVNPNPQLKQSKSLKLDCTCCKNCTIQNEVRSLTKNHHVRSKLKAIKKYEKNNQIKSSKSYKEEQNAEINDKTQQPLTYLKNNKFDQITCDYCRAYIPVKKEVLDSPHQGFLKKKKIKNDRKSRILKEEIQKGAGDRPTDRLNKYPQNSLKKKDRDKPHKNRNNVICNKIIEQKPLFEMQLSSDDYDIINKEEVMDNVVKFTSQKSHKNQTKQKRKKEIKSENKANKIKRSSKSIEEMTKQTPSNKSKQSVSSTPDTKRIQQICDHCQVKIKDKLRNDRRVSPTLKVHFMDKISTDNIEDKSLKNKKIKSDKKSNNVSESQKVIEKEIKTDASDPPFYKNIHFYQTHINKMKEIFKLNKDDTDNVCSGKIEQNPLFEMHLSSGDYDIINKEQFMDNVTKYGSRSKTNTDQTTKLHKKSCRCCICLSKKTGAYIHVSPKRSKMGNKVGRIFNTPQFQSPVLSHKPCTCGSLVCSKKLKEMHVPSKIHKRYFWKPCVCGSPICDRESAAMRAINPDKVTCICEEVHKRKKNKIKMKKYKIEANQRAARRKLLEKEDKIRRQKRLKEDKKMEKRINKKASDLVLLGESVIDIGKLGITACADILRSVARTASHPKHAYYTLKAMKEDPQLMARHLKTAYGDSGVAATARRVRLRCLAMRGVKKVKNTLEKYALTNYLLHIADSDPKKRLIKKKRPQRLRERLDFGCSLYMASLRKRPYLSVYDRCPWFYPHFLSLLNVWKQFADITLFLLAVVVWSPCILCMELCRAMMCCFFCTG